MNRHEKAGKTQAVQDQASRERTHDATKYILGHDTKPELKAIWELSSFQDTDSLKSRWNLF